MVVGLAMLNPYPNNKINGNQNHGLTFIYYKDYRQVCAPTSDNHYLNVPILYTMSSSQVYSSIGKHRKLSAGTLAASEPAPQY